MKLCFVLPEGVSSSVVSGIPAAHSVFIRHKDLARSGGGSTEDVMNQIRAVHDAGLDPVLVWDVLPDDQAILRGGALLLQLQDLPWRGVRVQDAGAARFLQQHHPQRELHLVLETGNHNGEAIQAWVESFPNVRSVALSNEIPLGQIETMRSRIKAEIEIQVLGRLLLFYSPRPLLSGSQPDDMEQLALERVAIEAERGRCFPVVENQHGTMMFYEKELMLLSWLDDIAAAGVDRVRLDLQHYPASIVAPLSRFLTKRDASDLEKVKALMAPKLTRGFFKSNRTDKQFFKLKNPYLRNLASQTVADVLEVKRECYLALQVLKPFAVGDQLQMVTPEGGRQALTIKWIRDASGLNVTRAEAGFWLVNWVKSASSGARIIALDTDRDANEQ